MNYRHAFHAGNFADCAKHALLVWLLRAMQKKPAGVFVLDTHAGAGRYDLSAGPAERTGEWRQGIARLLENPPAPLADYVALVERCGLYPGSPVLIEALLRPGDALACCELHPEDHAALRQHFFRQSAVAVHHRDAWEALGGLLPPVHYKRALVLIDPPYEAPDEFTHLAAGLKKGLARFPAGVVAAWYPIKHMTPVRDFRETLRAAGLRDLVAAELHLRAPLDPTRLNGCGLLVVHPPWGFEAAAREILTALLARLGEGEDGQGIAVERWADE
jgi:23S rRNA (adenine2030-N6)-methyltransferase